MKYEQHQSSLVTTNQVDQKNDTFCLNESIS